MAPPQKETIGENRQRMQDIDKLGEFSSLNAFPSLEKIDSDDTDVSSGKRKDEQFEQDSKYELTNITSSFEENERKKELKGALGNRKIDDTGNSGVRSFDGQDVGNTASKGIPGCHAITKRSHC
ncbi:hypothetical protein AX774_g872 [Zancudomyces culisetae]|uniref:Uncharacterized protein n=1 Tax=Zancudomyces culisetae TaxID=1213189 RepID=A0A1R1PXB6_ZANCU|nr:hypothetical protein AX774_g872 [Zancudomyces culisetae]|eukprot:OMH85584.1 hypothetical protein AX774_g872 [Zancudomyces culisetae]